MSLIAVLMIFNMIFGNAAVNAVNDVKNPTPSNLYGKYKSLFMRLRQ